MRHRKKFNHLGRTTAHRKAMLSNMAVSLIKHKRIHTTLAKAKALQLFVEPLITKSKNDTTHSRRVVFGYLKDKDAVSVLFREVSEKVVNRPGGYTRILKTGNRLGDNAEMCFIELVDFNENMLSDSQASKKSSRRRRSRKKSSENEVKAQQNISETTKTEDNSEIVEKVEVEDANDSAADLNESESSDIENSTAIVDKAVEDTNEKEEQNQPKEKTELDEPIVDKKDDSEKASEKGDGKEESTDKK